MAEKNAAKRKAPTDAELEERMRALDDVEDAMHRAFNSGRASRAEITRQAQECGAEAVRLAGVAMEYDDEADEASRLAIITEGSHDRQRIRNARRRAKAARREAKTAHHQATAAAKESYEAIKFSTPGKLGFLRFVQIFYGVNIATTLLALLLTSRDTITYDSVTIMDWITIILQGVAFWFFINYYKVARPFVMATSAFSILVPAVISIYNGTFSFFGTILSSFWNIFLIIYMWRSKRVKAVLVNDFSSLTIQPDDERVRIQRHGWPFVRNLIIYFIVFSVLGHWMEAAMCQLIRLGLVQGEYDPTNTMLWRDWLYPYPMEGAAVVIIALVLFPLWKRLLEKYERTPLVAYGLSFLANALTCTIIEFSMGLVVNADLQLWDYTENFGNIMGQVCLQNTLAFGVAASLIAWIVYPTMERWIARIPSDVMNIAFVVIAIFGGILWSLYIVDPPENHAAEVGQSVTQQLETVKEVSEDMIWTVMDMQLNSETLRQRLEEDSYLTEEERKEMQEHLDNINKELDAMTKILDEKEAAEDEAELADAA